MIETAKAWRPLRGRIRLQTPYRENNREWLEGLGCKPSWSKKEGRWLISRVHLVAVTRTAAERFGRCEVWTDHNHQERCHKKCLIAKGDDCTCSCMGRNHGGGVVMEGAKELGDSGVILTDTTTIRAHYLIRRRPLPNVEKGPRPW